MYKNLIFSYIARFGYTGIFGSMMLGMIGLPVPDEVLMTFAGYMVYKGQLVYLMTLLVASVGAVCGMSFSYFIGRRFGLPLIRRFGPKIGISEKKLGATEIWFERFGKFAVTIGYFIPGVRHFTAYSAGISGWPYRQFLAYAAPGGIIWALTFVTLGKLLGEHWLSVSEKVHGYMTALLFAALGLAAVWLLARRWKAGRRAR